MKKNIKKYLFAGFLVFIASCGTAQKPAPLSALIKPEPLPPAVEVTAEVKAEEAPEVIRFKQSMKEATLDYYNGNYGGAIEKYIFLLKESGSEEVMANLATVYKDTGYYSDAIRYYEAALLKKDDPFWRMNLGYCRYFTKDIEGAKKDLENVFDVLDALKERDSDSFKMRTIAAFGLGLVFLEKKEGDNAAEMFRKVIEYDVRFAQAHYLLGDYYNGRGDNENALGCYKNTVKYDSSFYKSNLRMAEIYGKTGRYADAFENYKKVSFIEPGNKLVAEKVKEFCAKAQEYIKKSEASKEKSRKETKALKVNYIKEDKDIPVLKIVIVSGVENVRFKCAGSYNVYYDSRVVKKAEPEEDLKIWREGATIYIMGKYDSKPFEVWIKRNTALYFVPELKDATFTIFDVTLDRGSFWANNRDRSYRGVLKIATEDRGFHLVNEINLEEYLYSVVPSEIGSTANIEALKAQAVIARSYIYKRIESNNGSTEFHLCADVHCQAYTGVQNEQKSTTKAVDLTRGEIIANDKGCISAFYFATCGGRTSNVEDVWGGEKNSGLVGVGDYEEEEQKACYKNWPLTPENLDRWLKLSPVAYCAGDEVFRWFRIAEPEEVRNFKISRRDMNGYVREVFNGGKKYSLDRSRQALVGLRSSCYKVEKNLIYGCGWGHGVGLCQEGAIRMAARRKSYHEILTHYYLGAEVKKMYGMVLKAESREVTGEKTGTTE